MTEDQPKPEPSKPRLRPLPVIRDFILCEKIIKDQIQGKMSLIDVFENIQSVSFPTRYVCWYYCTLTDGHGDLDFEVLLQNLETDDKVLIWAGRITLDPVKTSGLINNIAPVFNAPGLYQFILRSPDGRVIGTKTFTVSQTPNSNPVL
jgi:uncharacterized protein DUF6941